jgi:hypothetical protein
MDRESDPITELRETLRMAPATWEPDRTPRRLPTLPQMRRRPQSGSIVPRSILALVRPPDLRPHIETNRRRAGAAISRVLRSARSFVVAAVDAVGVASHRVVRATDRAARWIVHALALTGSRVRPRRTLRPAATLPSPVEADTIPAAVDDGARHLEELERRRLEQRIEALGPDHPDVAILLQLAAERSALRGAPDEALALYARALRIQEATFGADSPALRPLLADLAELELELGREGDALLHRARREMLEPRSAAPADRSRVDGALGSRGSHKPTGAARARQ